MRDWLKYSVLSFLLIAALEIVPTMSYFLLGHDMSVTGPDMFFYTLRLSILFIVLILQGFLFYQNKKHREMRLKFLVAFCSIYTLLFTAGYVIRTYVALINDAGNPFFSDHILFLLPLVAQILIFNELFQKKEKDRSTYL